MDDSFFKQFAKKRIQHYGVNIKHILYKTNGYDNSSTSVCYPWQWYAEPANLSLTHTEALQKRKSQSEQSIKKI
tara:strand:+ start:277 stop:498 length:222 start_codon:yes stop_codon:yes gene_type:complete